MRISEIRNPQLFQDLCQLLLDATYPDFEIPNDVSGDRGIDGYVPSTKTIYAMYCPESYPPANNNYTRKIRSDLMKAAKARDELGYDVRRWVFITPAPMKEELNRYVRTMAERFGFSKGIPKSEAYLVNLLARHSHLRPQFLDLINADLERAVREVNKGVVAIGRKLQAQTLRRAAKKLPVRPGRLDPADFFQGRAKQLEALHDFCTQGRKGVLALVGIGGAGKTAIVRRFLEKKGWLDDAPDRPDGLFIWSFYDEGSAADFFNEAFVYFSRFLDEKNVRELNPNGRRANPHLLTDVLQRSNRRCLLVLDGLERIQLEKDNPDYSRGRLLDQPLRTLLGQIADGCGWTKAIVTTRISLADLAGRPKSQYRELSDLDHLEVNSARRLLQRLGVKGGERSIDKLAANYGRHALTLDVLGRQLTTYYDGKVSMAGELPALESVTGSPVLTKQATKLGRVLRAYETLLSPDELAVLQCLTIFRRPIDFESLQAVFHVDRKRVRKSETRFSSRHFRQILHSLLNLRLITVEKNNGHELFTSHPAIREHFRDLTQDRKELHAAFSSRLRDRLEDVPGKPPRDPRRLDDIVDLIYHTSEAGLADEAYRIYEDRLGGYLHLGWELGDHLRGAEVVHLFTADDKPTIKGRFDYVRLLIDAGLYWKNIGQLDDAIDQFKAAAATAEKAPVDIANLALALQNLSAMQVLRGAVHEAEETARIAVKHAREAKDERLIEGCRVRLATSLALQGHTREAEEIFRAGKARLTKERQRAFPRDWPGIRLGDLLIRQKRYAEAAALLNETRELSEHFDFRIITARADILLAELAYRTGDMKEARRALDRVFAWASTGYDEEMLIASYLVWAWLALENGDVTAAQRYTRVGLREAQQYGYSIYWIEFKLVQGRIALSQHAPERAERSATLALQGQRQRHGRPELLGAKASGYRWGEFDAIALWAETYSLRGNDEKANELKLEAANIRNRLSGP